VLFLLGAPAVAAIGFPGESPMVLMAIIAAAGFCVTGNNFGMNAVIGMIYPTPIRSMGTGWAQACGRIGALAAQIMGGVLLGMHLPTQELYLVPAFSLVIGAVAAGLLVMLCIRRFGGYRIDESAAADAAGLSDPLNARQPV
jgi:AAHS family 4-hydroxybenzoate transporter-like MFS transporter